MNTGPRLGSSLTCATQNWVSLLSPTSLFLVFPDTAPEHAVCRTMKRAGAAWWHQEASQGVWPGFIPALPLLYPVWLEADQYLCVLCLLSCKNDMSAELASLHYWWFNGLMCLKQGWIIYDRYDLDQVWDSINLREITFFLAEEAGIGIGDKELPI